MTYYNVDKVVEIISYYSVNIINVHENNQDDDLASVGVAQLTSQPSAGGISDQVANEALKRVNAGLFFSEIATDIRYLEQRLNRITSERNAQVVSLRMQGFSAVDIAEIIGVSKGTVYNLVDKAAEEICGV